MLVSLSIQNSDVKTNIWQHFMSVVNFDKALDTVGKHILVIQVCVGLTGAAPYKPHHSSSIKNPPHDT